MKTGKALPEVTLLRDARGERPENAVGIGDFWYEPEVWTLPLSPAGRVLYASLCSFLTHGQINCKDLRETLRPSSDEAIAATLEELVRHHLLVPITTSGALPGYEVRPVGKIEG